ncbi:MAG: FtsX-like permease family protein [Planctomycetota bacterium]
MILAGAVASSALRRSREAALLKCLGVTRGGVLRLFVVEYALVGLVSGLIGSIGAVALAWAFLNHVAEVESAPALLAVPVATLATGILSVLAGSAASSRPLRTPPLATLRG